MNKIKSAIILFLFLYSSLFAQTLSLKQCLDYADINSNNIKIAQFDSQISDEVVNEQIGRGLPQINFSGTLDDKLKIMTQLLPGEMLGKPGTFVPVQFGTKYNATGTLSLTQKLFDPSFWVGLKAAKLSREMSAKSITKTKEQTYYDVSASYYRAVITKMRLVNLKDILAASERMLKSNELKLQNGLVKKIDVDRMKVTFNNINSQVQQTELSYNQALNNLKFNMGMPVDNQIDIQDELIEIEENISDVYNNSNSFANRMDYQLQQTNIALYEADKQNNVMAYLPTLNFYANYGYSAMRQQFDFFNTDKTWYNTSTIGLELKIPVFSGFQKYAKVQQSELNISKSKESLKRTEQAIKVEVSNFYIQYINALDNIKNEKENLALAESVYKNTMLAFSQGSGSSIDVVQSESSLRESQNNYYSKLLTLYIAKLDLEKSQGTLISFTNNLR